MKKIIYLLGICLAVCIFLLSGNVFASQPYTSGERMLLDGYGVSTSGIELMEHITEKAEEENGLLDHYQTAGFAVLLIEGAYIDEYGNLNGEPECLVGELDCLRGVRSKGFGYADIAGSKMIDPEKTVFQVGSLSKPVSAYGALKMAEMGMVDLEASINDGYLDVRGDRDDSWELDVASGIDPEAIDQVNLDKIIHHKSGIDQNGGSLFGRGAYRGWESLDLDPEDDDPYDGDVYQKWSILNLPIIFTKLIPMPTIEELLNWNDNTPLVGKVKIYRDPRDDTDLPAYSGSAYTVMQLVMENMIYDNEDEGYLDSFVEDTPYHDIKDAEKWYKLFPQFMKDFVLDPLDMSDSTYLYSSTFLRNDPDDPDQRKLATCYKWVDNGTVIYVDNKSEPLHKIYVIKAAAGLHTTVVDYAKFLIHIMNEHNSQSGFQIDDIIQTTKLKHHNLEKKWHMFQRTSDGKIYLCQDSDVTKTISDHNITPEEYSHKVMDNLYWHNGVVDGWATLFCALPEKNACLVVMSNTGDKFYWGGYGISLEIADAWRAMYIDKFGTPVVGW